MNLNSKEIDPKFYEPSSSVFDKAYSWLYDHNPLPYSLQFWLQDKDIFHPVRVFQKLQNIARWAPVLWKDVDWDYSSIYSVLLFKIRNMKEHQELYSHHTGTMELVAQMSVVESALERLLKDNYAREAWEVHGQKFPRQDRWILLPNGNKQMHPLSDEEGESIRNLCNLEEEAWQNDMAIVSSSLTQNMRGWWD